MSKQLFEHLEVSPQFISPYTAFEHHNFLFCIIEEAAVLLTFTTFFQLEQRPPQPAPYNL